MIPTMYLLYIETCSSHHAKTTPNKEVTWKGKRTCWKRAHRIQKLCETIIYSMVKNNIIRLAIMAGK